MLSSMMYWWCVDDDVSIIEVYLGFRCVLDHWAGFEQISNISRFAILEIAQDHRTAPTHPKYICFVTKAYKHQETFQKTCSLCWRGTLRGINEVTSKSQILANPWRRSASQELPEAWFWRDFGSKMLYLRAQVELRVLPQHKYLANTCMDLL